MIEVINRLKYCTIFQHGVYHTNRVSHGWADEFPESVDIDEIMAKISTGKNILEQSFSSEVLGYTPPWNNTSKKTICVLEHLGFKYYSAQSNNRLETSLIERHITYDTVKSYVPYCFLKNLSEFQAEIMHVTTESKLIHGIMYHTNSLQHNERDCLLEFIDSFDEYSLTSCDYIKLFQ